MHLVLHYKVIHAKEISGWSEIHKEPKWCTKLAYKKILLKIKYKTCFSTDCCEDIRSPCTSNCISLGYGKWKITLFFVWISSLGRKLCINVLWSRLDRLLNMDLLWTRASLSILISETLNLSLLLQDSVYPFPLDYFWSIKIIFLKWKLNRIL